MDLPNFAIANKINAYQSFSLSLFSLLLSSSGRNRVPLATTRHTSLLPILPPLLLEQAFAFLTPLFVSFVDPSTIRRTCLVLWGGFFFWPLAFGSESPQSRRDGHAPLQRPSPLPFGIGFFSYLFFLFDSFFSLQKSVAWPKSL